jgi:hypothetical protein
MRACADFLAGPLRPTLQRCDGTDPVSRARADKALLALTTNRGCGGALGRPPKPKNPSLSQLDFIIIGNYERERERIFGRVSSVYTKTPVAGVPRVKVPPRYPVARPDTLSLKRASRNDVLG